MPNLFRGHEREAISPDKEGSALETKKRCQPSQSEARNQDRFPKGCDFRTEP